MMEVATPGGCACGCRGRRWVRPLGRQALVDELVERRLVLEQEMADVAEMIGLLEQEAGDATPSSGS